MIDVNLQLGSHPYDNAVTTTVGSLLAQLDRFGVDAGLVRHTDAVHYDPVAGNATLLTEVRDQPRLHPAFVVGPLDCGEHGGPDGLAAALDRDAVRAVWLYPGSHGWSVRGPEAVTLLEQLRRAGRPVFVDLDQCGWSDVAYLAAELSEVDVVVCSLGYRTLRQAFAVLDRHPRVHLDTSLLAAHQGLERIVLRFGDDRVAFGSGAPLLDAGGAYHRLALATLTDENAATVAARTGSRLLGLPAPEPRAPQPAPDGPAGGIVDVHTHIGLWPSSYLPAPWTDDLLDTMRRTGTAVSLLSSMRAIWSGEVRTGNAEAVEAARRHPGRIYVHAVANPHRREDRDELSELLGQPEVRGIKIHPDTHGCPIDDRRYDWILELAVEHGVPVLGHSFGGTPHSDPAGYGTVAGRHPELVLLAGHAGANPDGFRAMIAAGQEHPNLYAELCGSLMTGRWVRNLVAALGADRVLHGTDSTLIDPRFGVGRVLYAQLSAADRDQVLAGNARRLFGLDVNPCSNDPSEDN